MQRPAHAILVPVGRNPRPRGDAMVIWLNDKSRVEIPRNVVAEAGYWR